MFREIRLRRWGFYPFALLVITIASGSWGCSAALDNNDTVGSSPTASEVTAIPGEEALCDQLPKLIHKEPAQYPRLATQAGLEGTVLLKLYVETTGKVSDAQVYVSSGTPSLDEAALAAGRRCLFRPASNHGQVIPMWVVIRYQFTLES